MYDSFEAAQAAHEAMMRDIAGDDEVSDDAFHDTAVEVILLCDAEVGAEFARTQGISTQHPTIVAQRPDITAVRTNFSLLW